MRPGLLAKLKHVQQVLASKVVLKDGFSWPPKSIAGLDVAFKGDMAFSACVLLSFPDLKVLEVSRASSRPRLPYIPGFLAFREVPAMLKALRGLGQEPDVVMVDAQGIAHPRRCGEATHLGIVAGLPSVGVAKRVLCGTYPTRPRRPDTWSPLYHEGDIVGFIYLSKARCRPLVISPGHLISLETSLRLVRACIRGHKLPEPTRLAHLAASEMARQA